MATHWRRVWLGLVALPVCVVAATPGARFDADPDRLVYITAHWKDRAELIRIAQQFQHLDVDERAHVARTEASADDLRALRRAGIRFEIDDAATQRMRDSEAKFAQDQLVANAIPNFPCYRTVEETYATMDALAALRPSIATVRDIGPTWTWQKTGGAQGYRMRVLRLDNTAVTGTKASMVVLSAIHAREYTTAEVVTRFAEWLVRDYGTDPEATWLVDTFRFHFILQGNPDGRKKAESGLSWRKNTNTDNGVCSANNYGVDLNRNFPWQWAQTPGGSSSNPCASNYRGPSVTSEAETQNMLRYIVGTRGSTGTYSGGALPDFRTDTGAAPSDYRGMFLDIHSAARLVLWPWAWSNATAPNATALRTLGRRLAYFNSYQPKQWIGLYPADGTNTDTVYGITGAPSYTLELGQAFFETCTSFESATYPRNLEALKYAARNLWSPYNSPSGPETTAIGLSAPSVQRGQPFAVSAWVDDGRFNQTQGTEPVQNIANVRAYVDARPWTTGAAFIAMQATDGVFDSAREQATVNLPTAGLSTGRHVVFVRGTDASGRAGTPKALYFDVTD